MLHELEPDLLRSFVAIAETGSFTAAAGRVARTQSAVSMQMKRLEEQVGRELFVRDGRTTALSRNGELLLGHARRILRAHQEALAALHPEALEGGVRFGAPEDYMSSFLPEILSRFAASHPRVHVEMMCQSSTELLRDLKAGKVDLALTTQGNGETGGQLVRREPLVWAAPGNHCVHERDPVPLAVFQSGCSFRRSATDALAETGRGARIAYTSVSLTGIYAALDAGLAIAAILRSNLRPGLRVLDASDGFPPLPEVGIVLQRAAGPASPVLDRLEEHIMASFETIPALALAA